MTYAIIETGGKQYLVSVGMKLKIEKLLGSNDLLNFDRVLLVVNNGEIQIGRPYLKNAEVLAQRIGEGQAKKIEIFRYHSKTRYRKKKGHRQQFTEILIKEIKFK